MFSAIENVWSSVANYLIGMFANVTPIFYDSTANSGAGALTFVGVLAMVTAGVSLILLVFNIIRSFLVARA